MTERVCENCAVVDDELVLVRRVYVVPEAWDRAASYQVVDPPELWCISCMSQYPFELVADEESGDDADDADNE